MHILNWNFLCLSIKQWWTKKSRTEENLFFSRHTKTIPKTISNNNFFQQLGFYSVKDHANLVFSRSIFIFELEIILKIFKVLKLKLKFSSVRIFFSLYWSILYNLPWMYHKKINLCVKFTDKLQLFTVHKIVSLFSGRFC